MSKTPDLDRLIGSLQTPTAPASVSTRYQPGPTEHPIGGIANLGNGNLSIIGWGGRSRLEAAAVAIFAAWKPIGNFSDAAQQAVFAAEALLNALDKRAREISDEIKHATEN